MKTPSPQRRLGNALRAMVLGISWPRGRTLFSFMGAPGVAVSGWLAVTDDAESAVRGSQSGTCTSGTDHNRAAFHREQRRSVNAALKVSRFDELGALPRHRPTSYVGTVCTILDGLTFEQFREREEKSAEAGDPPQRKLEDYGGVPADA